MMTVFQSDSVSSPGQQTLFKSQPCYTENEAWIASMRASTYVNSDVTSLFLLILYDALFTVTGTRIENEA